MSRDGGLVRLFHLARTLIVLRRQGYRLVFVRISKPAAIVSGSFSRLFGWKTLYWLSGAIDDFNQQQRFFTRVKERISRTATLGLIHAFVTGPEAMISYYQQVFGLRRDRMILLYNDIDLGRFVQRQPSNVPGAHIRILAVHRLSPVRETNRYLPSLVRSLNKFATSGTQLVFDIVGEGPERSDIEATARLAEQGLTITLHGAVPNLKVQEFYQKADVFVMPSYREGFPRVILEAMATGLAIVSTDAGGTRDLFGPLQQEFVVPRDDADGFAKCVARLIGDPLKRHQLAEENLERVQRYSTDAVARMYDDKLLRVASGEQVS